MPYDNFGCMGVLFARCQYERFEGFNDIAQILLYP